MSEFVTYVDFEGREYVLPRGTIRFVPYLSLLIPEDEMATIEKIDLRANLVPGNPLTAAGSNFLPTFLTFLHHFAADNYVTHCAERSSDLATLPPAEQAERLAEIHEAMISGTILHPDGQRQRYNPWPIAWVGLLDPSYEEVMPRRYWQLVKPFLTRRELAERGYQVDVRLVEEAEQKLLDDPKVTANTRRHRELFRALLAKQPDLRLAHERLTAAETIIPIEQLIAWQLASLYLGCYPFQKLIEIGLAVWIDHYPEQYVARSELFARLMASEQRIDVVRQANRHKP